MCEFKDKVAVITGGAQGIGRYTTEMFHKEGAFVCVIDLQEQPEGSEGWADLYFAGDISKEDVLRDFSGTVLSAVIGGALGKFTFFDVMDLLGKGTLGMGERRQKAIRRRRAGLPRSHTRLRSALPVRQGSTAYPRAGSRPGELFIPVPTQTSTPQGASAGRKTSPMRSGSSARKRRGSSPGRTSASTEE